MLLHQPSSCKLSTGTECTSACANQPKFDTNKSSTYVGSDEVSEISFETGIGVDTLQYSGEYVLWLRTGYDTVTVGGISTPDVELYTIINQTSAFDVDPQSGIQGALSFPLSAVIVMSINVVQTGMGPQVSGFWQGLLDQGYNGARSSADSPLRRLNTGPCSALWLVPDAKVCGKRRTDDWRH